MGASIARNLAHHGSKVIGYDISWERTQKLLELKEENITGYKTLEEVVKNLKTPRVFLVMVNAEYVDDVIKSLKPLLEKNDIIIDGGNSHWPDTERRQKEIADSGIHFVGMGISGGQEGALNGPSMMFGGAPEDWERCKPILEPIAAKSADGQPCVDFMGKGGSGHFVKMVHNAIEYSDMQLIAETYFLLKNSLNKSNDEIADIFGEWNKGVLKSYLVEITEKVLRKKEGDVSLIDLIVDAAEQKGTGKWTSQDSYDIPACTPAFGEAVYARVLSSLKDERVEAEKVINHHSIENSEIKITVEDLEKALYASKIISYAQGLCMIQKFSKKNGYDIDISKCAKVWRGGCIIRADFLNDISKYYTKETKNLLLIPFFKEAVEQRLESLRNIVAYSSLKALPVPLYSSCLSYLDSYTRAKLPANLIQGLRDFFGAHTYERIDKCGHFHTEWTA